MTANMVPDSGPGKGMKQVQAGYGTSDEGRVVVPSATGAAGGAQLGMTNGPRPSTVIEAGRATRVITPPGQVPPSAPQAVPPSAVPALLLEETGSDGAVPPAPVYAAPTVTAPTPAAGQPHDLPPEVVSPPRVSVTIAAVDSPALRWRGRFHLVTVNETCVALGYDTRFVWADSPLLPFPQMTVVRVIIQASTAAGAQPVQLNCVFLDITHTSNGVEYFVMPRQSAAFAEEPPPA